MPIESWFPVGFKLPDGNKLRLAKQEGIDWQIFETLSTQNSLIATNVLWEKWRQSGVIEEGVFAEFEFGGRKFYSLSSDRGQILSTLSECSVPDSVNEALAFAKSLKATRKTDSKSDLSKGIYVEKISRILTTGELSPAIEDSVILGFWLTGVSIPVESTRRLNSLLGWMPAREIRRVIEAAGFEYKPREDLTKQAANKDGREQSKGFRLIGRPELEHFFNEHVIEIIENSERYKKLGIDFPSAIILHGLPGCGKTFAVDRLVDYLDWPSFSIEASSVASPYIHETSRKVAEVFTSAIENAPSVLVIDEMESFLSDRQGAQHHKVEEVAEFLRRIPEAVSNQVLVIAMTNRIEMIDSAILRRGRFDHIFEVKMATANEVSDLLDHLLNEVECDSDLNVAEVSEHLAGRPMSDITFVVREAARISAKAGRDSINQQALLTALASTPERSKKEEKRRIGFY
ncbi:ATP-binding protein [Pseudomonadota bacterium]